jgi:hypothetical protein
MRTIPNLPFILRQKNFVRDNIVINLFNFTSHGTFVEIGTTSDPTRSGTYLLEKFYNWQGFCVESNRDKLYLLENFRTCEIISPKKINSFTMKTLWANKDIPRKIDYLNININDPSIVVDSINFDEFKFGTVSLFTNSTKFDRIFWSNGYSTLCRSDTLNQFVSDRL